MNGLLTIMEVADRVGMTTQAIYKRLTTDLSPYLLTVGKVKMLKIEVIKILKHPSDGKQPIPTDNMLLEYIDILKEQLQVKDKQIEEMNKHIFSLLELQKQYLEFLLIREQQVNLYPQKKKLF